METIDLFELHAGFCKTLSNPKRLMILAFLARREASVGEIADAIGVPLSNVSQHLAVLKTHKLVNARKDGQTVHYSLADRRIIQACTLIRSVLLDNMKKSGRIAQVANPRYVVTEA